MHKITYKVFLWIGFQQVLFDFNLMYNSVNENALVQKWSIIEEKLKSLMEGRLNNYQFDTQWPDEIKNFLILIRLLPFKQGGRSIASCETFLNSINRFVVFSNVH